jgi:predicted NBD/HSP70 family sugar kinase
MSGNGVSRSELAVLDVIRARGTITRGSLSAAVGLSPAMTARIVQRLRSIGLVRESGRLTAHGPGRPTLLIELHPNAARLVGVDVGTELLHLVLVDVHGTMEHHLELNSALLDGLNQDRIVATLAFIIGDFARDSGINLTEIAVTGVALTGIVDSLNGECVLRSHTPGWERFHLADRLGHVLNMPVVLGESSRARAVAELRLGGGRAARNFLYVDAGTAIGAGIVIDGRPYRGEGGLAGELGHITVDANGPLCRCGNRGCIQASSPARALVQRARELLRGGVYSALSVDGDSLDVAAILAAAERGDKMALGLLTEAGERLGEAISMALNLLGIELVILGGSLIEDSGVILEAATRVVRLRVLPVVGRERMLIRSMLGRESGARGIAIQAADWLFDAPAKRVFSRARAGNGFNGQAVEPARESVGAL